ncbi:helix-turn-helix transcriptional regulator [Martelella alba]|uniref:Helix-turn-helix domain-containing protein n=1 Tax=Martelella alba TaxID=2590451 RepID=A0ABY2SLE9_9HYPH|nr:helix-turn-helix transcriptional regulator [Martelella alba]TKI05977.1 helix-turn-helix domain-containing protein [Martelella alba]
MALSETKDNLLGAYLKDRRTRLDPVALGYPPSRRRTSGLRREEVAQRANVSTTWYTWLEQGRGGAPSAGALDRIARALMLSHVEREHLFLLALGRPPEAHYQESEGISPRLQRILDTLAYSPAIIRTCTWDLTAWNPAAAAVFDYNALQPGQMNILRRIFYEPAARAAQLDWESVARFAVAAFRVDVMRAGAAKNTEALVNELCRRSPEFAALWRDNDVRTHGEGVKHLRHPELGIIALEYSAFAVDGRPDLSMVIFNPVTAEDTRKIRTLMERRPIMAKALQGGLKA